MSDGEGRSFLVDEVDGRRIVLISLGFFSEVLLRSGLSSTLLFWELESELNCDFYSGLSHLELGFCDVCFRLPANFFTSLIVPLAIRCYLFFLLSNCTRVKDQLKSKSCPATLLPEMQTNSIEDAPLVKSQIWDANVNI